MSADPERWRRLWRDINPRINPAPWFQRLLAAWSEPHRHYHNLAHLADCLRGLDSASGHGGGHTAVELALWFHDAIYDPRAGDNEERSADLARQCLHEAAVAHQTTEQVARLVLATKRHEVALDPDAPLMIDVDLSILGQPPARFDEYERQIRAEYAWVPEKLFAEKRAEILEGFLARQTLFTTEWFRQKYEATARANLSRSIRTLRAVSN